MKNSTIALIILAVTIILFISGKVPLAVTAVSSALAMGIFGVISFKTVFAGFSSDVTMMVLGALILGETLFETGVAEKMGTEMIKLVGNNERLFIIVCILVSAILSAFLSDSAVVAMLIPVVAATAAGSNGKIRAESAYMAIGFASNFGGGMTLVGSTPNVIAQGLLTDNGLTAMSFFDLTLGSIPRLIFMVLFYATIGYTMQNHIFRFKETRPEYTNKRSEGKVYKKSKMIISSGIMLFAIFGFVTGIWTVGMVAMTAGMLCIITRCVDLKALYYHLDWSTIWVMAGSLGFAAGISESGAGQLIADKFIGLLGGDISMFKLLIMMTVLSALLANMMSSTATMAMIGPIALAMALSLGYDAKPVLMVITWGINFAFLSPVATVPITMTLVGGYRFLDYTKMGILQVIIGMTLTIACYPFIFNLG